METEWQLRHHHRRGKSERGIPAPLNTAAEALSALKLLRPVAYRETLAPAEAVKVCFHDAGHILGSAWLEITDGDEGRPRTLVFSGDLGMSGRPVLCDPDPVVPEADQLLIESTYGDRQHRSLPETEDEIVAAPARTRAARVSRGSRSMLTSRWPMRRRGNHFGQRHVRGRTDQVSPARKPATRRMQHPDRRLPGGGRFRSGRASTPSAGCRHMPTKGHCSLGYAASTSRRGKPSSSMARQRRRPIARRLSVTSWAGPTCSRRTPASTSPSEANNRLFAQASLTATLTGQACQRRATATAVRQRSLLSARSAAAIPGSKRLSSRHCAATSSSPAHRPTPIPAR